MTAGIQRQSGAAQIPGAAALLDDVARVAQADGRRRAMDGNGAEVVAGIGQRDRVAGGEHGQFARGNGGALADATTAIEGQRTGGETEGASQIEAAATAGAADGQAGQGANWQQAHFRRRQVQAGDRRAAAIDGDIAASAGRLQQQAAGTGDGARKVDFIGGQIDGIGVETDQVAEVEHAAAGIEGERAAAGRLHIDEIVKADADATEVAGGGNDAGVIDLRPGDRERRQGNARAAVDGQAGQCTLQLAETGDAAPAEVEGQSLVAADCPPEAEHAIGGTQGQVIVDRHRAAEGDITAATVDGGSARHCHRALEINGVVGGRQVHAHVGQAAGSLGADGVEGGGGVGKIDGATAFGFQLQRAGNVLALRLADAVDADGAAAAGREQQAARSRDALQLVAGNMHAAGDGGRRASQINVVVVDAANRQQAGAGRDRAAAIHLQVGRRDAQGVVGDVERNAAWQNQGAAAVAGGASREGDVVAGRAALHQGDVVLRGVALQAAGVDVRQRQIVASHADVGQCGGQTELASQHDIAAAARLDDQVMGAVDGALGGIEGDRAAGGDAGVAAQAGRARDTQITRSLRAQIAIEGDVAARIEAGRVSLVTAGGDRGQGNAGGADIKRGQRCDGADGAAKYHGAAAGADGQRCGAIDGASESERRIVAVDGSRTTVEVEGSAKADAITGVKAQRAGGWSVQSDGAGEGGADAAVADADIAAEGQRSLRADARGGGHGGGKTGGTAREQVECIAGAAADRRGGAERRAKAGGAAAGIDDQVVGAVQAALHIDVAVVRIDGDGATGEDDGTAEGQAAIARQGAGGAAAAHRQGTSAKVGTEAATDVAAGEAGIVLQHQVAATRSEQPRVGRQGGSESGHAAASERDGGANATADIADGLAEIDGATAAIDGQVLRAADGVGKVDDAIVAGDAGRPGGQGERAVEIDLAGTAGVADIAVDGDATGRRELHRTGHREPRLRQRQGIGIDRQAGQRRIEILETADTASITGRRGQGVDGQRMGAVDAGAERGQAAIRAHRGIARQAQAAIEGDAIVAAEGDAAHGGAAGQGAATAAVTQADVAGKTAGPVQVDAAVGFQGAAKMDGGGVDVERGAAGRAEPGDMTDGAIEGDAAAASVGAELVAAVDDAAKDDVGIDRVDGRGGRQGQRAVKRDRPRRRTGQGAADGDAGGVVGLRAGDTETARHDDGAGSGIQAADVGADIADADDVLRAGVERERIRAADRTGERDGAVVRSDGAGARLQLQAAIEGQVVVAADVHATEFAEGDGAAKDRRLGAMAQDDIVLQHQRAGHADAVVGRERLVEGGGAAALQQQGGGAGSADIADGIVKIDRAARVDAQRVTSAGHRAVKNHRRRGTGAGVIDLHGRAQRHRAVKGDGAGGGAGHRARQGDAAIAGVGLGAGDADRVGHAQGGMRVHFQRRAAGRDAQQLRDGAAGRGQRHFMGADADDGTR